METVLITPLPDVPRDDDHCNLCGRQFRDADLPFFPYRGERVWRGYHGGAGRRGGRLVSVGECCVRELWAGGGECDENPQCYSPMEKLVEMAVRATAIALGEG
jgi:hypothetical protein